MADLRFDGKVAIITGAGFGLGRAYALLFAERGASVVVNDLGSKRDGVGASSSVAEAVVTEIKRKGGKAVADSNSVIDGERIVQTALDNFGRVDIVVNNAGILRDKSFARISDTDWNLIYEVHLKGAFIVTRAAWPHFRKQNYGRVIFTSSNAGVCGNFGQANYSAAKMGLVGLSNTLAIEGRKNNIHSNVIVPTAASRLTEDILPKDLYEQLKPELIAPVVVWLCHEKCEENGSIIESAGGWASKIMLVRGNGTLLRKSLDDVVTLENVQAKWTQITDMSGASEVGSIQESTVSLMAQLDAIAKGKCDEETSVFSYNGKDTILYSLGIGSSVAVNSDLKYLYESHENFTVFPTFGVLPALFAVMSSDKGSSAIPGKTYDLSNVLHGEQYMELYRPLPTEGKLKSIVNVADVVDKTKGALIVFDADTYDEQGEKICFNQCVTFVKGVGGFGGKRSSSVQKPLISEPSRAPDAEVTEKTSTDQAAIYRLSGDSNPLHIDPNFSILGGYDTPILHGLCTLGFAIRHVLYKYANNEPSRFKAFKVRFAGPVTPGQTLTTQMWKEDKRIHFVTYVVETNSVVLSGGYVDLSEVEPYAELKLRPVNGETLKSEAIFAAMIDQLKSDPSIPKKINGVFLYNITKDKKIVSVWTADLKTGELYRGSPKEGVKVDTTMTIDDSDMEDMYTGKLSPQVAFLKGKLKIKGNVLLAQKLKSLNLEAKL